MTRRDFIKASALGVPLPLFGIPIRSLIGSTEQHFISSIGDKNQNPYLTDGLIAMWDGTWNMGFDEHDEGSPVWVDLSGNNNNCILSQWAKWSANALLCDGTHYSAMSPSSGIESVWYCEIVYDRVLTTYGYFSFFARKHIGNSQGMSDLSVAFRNNDLMFASGKMAIDGVFKSTYFKDVPLKGTAACNFRDGRLYVNSEEILSSSGSESWSQTTIGEIGGRYARTGNVYKGGILCIRLYSRVLSESEIAHNYLIDIERFGI